MGTQIGLGRGRQNKRDLAMVKDPLIDFEEVVVGMRSLGLNPGPEGISRDEIASHVEGSKQGLSTLERIL